MKLLSFINPHTRKKTWGQVSSDKVYDLGGFVE